MTSGSRRPLDGRVALVTGGASGIGRACALELAAAGAAVAIGSRTAPAAPSRPAVENTHYPTDDELAGVVGFLCREEARGITGENIGVTGGALY